MAVATTAACPDTAAATETATDTILSSPDILYKLIVIEAFTALVSGEATSITSATISLADIQDWRDLAHYMAATTRMGWKWWHGVMRAGRGSAPVLTLLYEEPEEGKEGARSTRQASTGDMPGRIGDASEV